MEDTECTSKKVGGSPRHPRTPLTDVRTDFHYSQPLPTFGRSRAVRYGGIRGVVRHGFEWQLPDEPAEEVIKLSDRRRLGQVLRRWGPGRFCVVALSIRFVLLKWTMGVSSIDRSFVCSFVPFAR